MKISLNVAKVLIFLVLATFSIGAMAYGGGATASTSCKKPKFSEMTPPKSTVVAPGSEFSFVASRDTKPNSIKVDIKGHNVALVTEKQKLGNYLVSGNLPEDVKQGFVRVAISAKTDRSCDGTAGWLLKIEE